MATISWIKGVNGKWTDALDWSGDAVPGPDDDASLSATGTYTVTSDARVIVSSLTTAAGATLKIAAGNFIINPVSGTDLGVNAGTIKVANGAGFQLGGDGTSFDNTGTISLNSTGEATTLYISGGETLNGAGNVVLSNNPNNVITGIFGGSAVFWNYGNTISGAGQIGGNNLTLINLGTIDANSAKYALTIGTPNQAIYNSGLMEATGGGTLVIDYAVVNGPPYNPYSTLNGTIEATGKGSTVDFYGGSSIYGGVVTIGAGATVDAQQSTVLDGVTVTDNGALLATLSTTLTLENTTINATISEKGGVITGGLIEGSDFLLVPATIVFSDATINGGALEVASGGVIETASDTANTLNLVTIIAGTTVTVVDDSTLTLTGAITNHGTLALESSSDATTLAIGANVTLTGGGALTLSDSAENQIVASGATAASPFTLTNTNNTISGSGSIGDGDQTLTLINQAHGVIDATGANALMIDTGNTVTNAGILEATNPNTLAATGGLVIVDAVANSGMIEANGGNVTINGALSGAGHIEIFGSNTVTLGSSATNGVTFEPGANSSLILIAAQSFFGKVTGLASTDTIDLTNFAFGPTASPTVSITKITGSGAVGSTTNVTLTDGTLSETLHLVNTTAGEFGNSASDYSLTPDNNVPIVGTLFHALAA